MSYLPSEIWEKILSDLDCFTIVKCTRVCRFFHELVNKSDLLNYLVDLGVAGYVDNPQYVAPSRERLLQLRERFRSRKKVACAVGVSYPHCRNYLHMNISGEFVIRQSQPEEKQILYEILQMETEDSKAPSILQLAQNTCWILFNGNRSYSRPDNSVKLRWRLCTHAFF